MEKTEPEIGQTIEFNVRMKRVTEEEFNKFIQEYPRELESNFFMDWEDYYDFNGKSPKDLGELYSYKVARKYFGWYGKEYYIKEEVDEDE